MKYNIMYGDVKIITKEKPLKTEIVKTTWVENSNHLRFKGKRYKIVEIINQIQLGNTRFAPDYE